MDVLEFCGYGANTIKKFKISPDAFAQMALQLGVFKMTGTWLRLQYCSNNYSFPGKELSHSRECVLCTAGVS